MKSISKEVESDLLKLGLYQVVGGIIGMCLIVWSIFKIQSITGPSLVLSIFILLFFTYSVFCGVLCIKAKDNALKYSLVNQLFQLIGFAMFGFAFKYVAGVYLTIGLDLTNTIEFGFNAGISNFNFNINMHADRLEVDFNIVAFGIIFWIDKLMKKIKTEMEIRQVSSIASAEEDCPTLP